MALFDRVDSGFPELDEALDYFRIGDNVVCRLTELDDFRLFAEAFAKQGVKDGRNVVYVRFAEHAPLLGEMEGVTLTEIPPSKRFERFTVTLHELIQSMPEETYYIFDCLSDLQTAWSTDLLISNFFTLIGKLTEEKHAIAYFPIMRAMHSFDCMANIRDRTSVFLDVFSDDKYIFIRPVKVWQRDTPTMFLPHVYDKEVHTFEPVMSGVVASRFYQIMNQSLSDSSESYQDFWDRFFQQNELLYQNGIDITEACNRMCRIMITRDETLRPMVRENFTPEDYFQVRSRMIGTGLIGGKAAGMLMSRKLIENYEPEIFARLEPHDSFYVGNDVFYAYIIENGMWDLRVRQRSEEGYFSAAEEIADALMHGAFSPKIEEQFKRMLEYYGQDPYIVRSSSILEDSFGNAFAGKYESVFCSNHGSIEERLAEFENAARIVYASTMSKAALDYRKRRGLDERDEQMALLVQRVSGSRYGNHFLPSAAGVGYSTSPYKFGASDGEENSGMLRLVMGLGTAAVDRNQGSYPRIVFCNDPKKKISATAAESHQYSQQVIDAVNTETGAIDGLGISWATSTLPEYQQRQLLSHDYDAESMFLNRGQKRKVFYVSCDGIVNNEQLMNDFKTILRVLQEKYDYPVDIEFTINLSDEGDYRIGAPGGPAGEGHLPRERSLLHGHVPVEESGPPRVRRPRRVLQHALQREVRGPHRHQRGQLGVPGEGQVPRPHGARAHLHVVSGTGRPHEFRGHLRVRHHRGSRGDPRRLHAGTLLRLPHLPGPRRSGHPVHGGLPQREDPALPPRAPRRRTELPREVLPGRRCSEGHRPRLRPRRHGLPHLLRLPVRKTPRPHPRTVNQKDLPAFAERSSLL